jgi:hypothetical protein
MAEDNASEPAVIWLFTSLIVVASAALIGRTVWLMDRGFDFTDQSFYLMSIQRPADYELIYGLWGYALKPLYELAGGSVACLRRIGAVILVGSGCLAGMVVASEARLNWRQPARIQILAVCAVLPLTYYTLWVPTPAYNWFALLGGLAIFKAILLLHTPDSTKSSAVWAAIAAVLAAFARPHNAVGCGVLYLMAVLLVLPTAKARVTQLVWAAAATVVATLATASLLPVAGIFKQLSEYDAIFGMSHPIAFSFVDQQLVFLRDAKAWLLSPVLFGAIIFMRRGGRNIYRNIHGGLRALLIAAALAVMLGAVLSEILSPNINRVGARTAALAFAALILAALKEDVDLRLIKSRLLLSSLGRQRWVRRIRSISNCRFSSACGSLLPSRLWSSPCRRVVRRLRRPRSWRCVSYFWISISDCHRRSGSPARSRCRMSRRKQAGGPN